MKSDLNTVVLPFPKQLMSASRSALSMPLAFGREVRNMLMAADGAGAKRNGVVKVGSAFAGHVITAVMGFMASGGYQLLVATDAGKIYRQNGAGWDEVYTGLNTAGVIRTVLFGGRLLLCNGLDDVLAYDGVSWSRVSTLVKDAASGLTYVGATQFSIASDAVFYAVGSTVKCVLSSGSVTGIVTAVAATGSVVTVTLSGVTLNATLSEVWFTVRPPRVAYLAVAHDRLWGFGKGAVAAQMSADVDRLRVYYTTGVNDYTAWPDVETGIVPSLNLADKAGVADELMAMAVRDGMTVFLGRNHLQLWVGSDPDADGDFAWSKTIPLGVIHGGAVLELPNDLLFVSRQGVRTLSRTVQTEQLDVSDVGGELDPTVLELTQRVMGDAVLYKRVTGVRQEAQGWLGLALDDKTLVWQIGSFGKGWVVFDGVFEGVTGAHTSPDGVLFVAKGGQLYRYDVTAWSDDGGNIVTRWWSPWVSPGKGRRWANSYVEVLAAPAVQVPFRLERYRDYDDGNPQVLEMMTPPEPDYWDEANWDAGLWDNGTLAVPVTRDHVVANVLAYAVESATGTGPFTIFGIKLYGMGEK